MSDFFVWSEKYRPSSFDDFLGQKSIVDSVKSLVAKGNLPHLLFAGPPGVGKSTLALIVAKSLFGSGWKSSFLELNASDERGIDVVRSKVKDFARTKAFNVPFKIIFLDECDALTPEAQQALRRTMENFTNSCRFVLSCNYPSRIIEPIQSRCVVYWFRPLGNDWVLALIDRIAASEGLDVDDNAKNALLAACEGDCRRVVNLLQAIGVGSKKVTQEAVSAMAGLARPKDLGEMVSLALKGDFVRARKLLLSILLDGNSGLDVVKLVQKEIWNLDIVIKEKLALVDKCAEFEFRLVEGSDEFIQLEALLAQFGLLRASQ
ncbi:replication factor C small subunit [Candidatus Woesearchaeota archaeon]|nr:replication factor C small subunit [Candidatus Woesearchaeota archaeon]